MTMFGQLLRGGFSALKWALCGVGALALLLAGLLSAPLVRLPELQSISAARATVDLTGLPAVERFQARDGTWLGFRHYAASGRATGRAAIVVHGSSGSSGGTIHTLSQGLGAGRGGSFAIGIRGEGAPGPRGDIRYVCRLQGDLADFVAVLRKSVPLAPLT